jgi:hypothetical protein
MSRYLLTLHNQSDRDRAIRLVYDAPVGARVEVKAVKRSLPQNDRMWAMLTDVAQQLPWHGKRLRPDDWKLLFLDALKRETQTVPNLDGTGLVSLRASSSDLSKSEMSDLFILIEQFGARHGVKFADDASAA